MSPSPMLMSRWNSGEAAMRCNASSASPRSLVITASPRGTAGMVAARLVLDVADVDDMAEQLALIGLRQGPSDIGAETEIDAGDVVERIALARQAAQQQEAPSVAQIVGEPPEDGAEARQ